LFEGTDMLTDTDWMMHAKATRSMASRSLRQGETEVAQRLFQAATQMETIAQTTPSTAQGGNVVKLATAAADMKRAEPALNLSNAS
jgi:hypothetical protein